jgi:hypothetical protein
MQRLSFVLAALLATGACGDNAPVSPDGKTKYDGIVTKKDGQPAGENPVTTDGGPKPDKPPALPSALQAVVNAMTLPKNNSEYACNIDGSGKKNALGGIMFLINTFNLGSMSPQAALDSQLSSGSLILLMDVQAKAIDNDPSMKLQAFMGSDSDGQPSDNFSGSEELNIAIDSPKDLIMPGAIVASHLKTQPGNLLAPVPFGTTTTTLSLTKTVVEADLSSTPLSAMTKGTICGAIPQTDIDNKLLPIIANDVDATYKSPNTPQGTKDMMKILDTNGDGTITAKDLKENIALQAAGLKADVDTDGDKTPDAMSMGLAFTAVGAKIKK